LAALMSVQTVFYIVGLTLTAAALLVSFAGLKAKGFPSKGAVGGILAVFLALVVATCGLAVATAREEQDHRRHEQAEAHKLTEESEQTVESSDETSGSDSAEGDESAGAGGPGGTLELKADPSQLAYDTKELSSKPGEVTINFDNPAPIPHDVVIRSGDGEEIARTDVIQESKDSLVANLEPGDYQFFCSVPGHEQAGMVGTLKVG
jgi:plastocyanin